MFLVMSLESLSLDYYNVEMSEDDSDEESNLGEKW